MKTGIVTIELGQIFDKFFDNRQKGDYADMVTFEKEKVQGWLDETKIFVDAIEKAIRDQST